MCTRSMKKLLKKGLGRNMNLKLRLKFGDILKLLLGSDVMILDPYTNSIYRVQKGNDTYICKG